jgi:endonuclease/exonuclease/phosphatase family metal-dependent hydrolase
VITSRNWGARLRRAVAVRWPDLIKSNGGGANAILVREQVIVEHRRTSLCLWPERRWVHAVATAGGTWLANLHTEATAAQGAEAAQLVRRWAGAMPAVLGGDFNVSPADLDQPLGDAGFSYLGGSGTDLIYAAGFTSQPEAHALERGKLSDHAPVLVSLEAQR